MGLKAVAALVAVAMFGLYFTPIVLKLRELPLAIVVLAGLACAALDAWMSASNGTGVAPRGGAAHTEDGDGGA